VFINPELEELTDDMGQYQEGCLSVPGFYENVDRPLRVRVKAQDRDGKPFELIAEGLLAVCIQHECDHLNGKLFVDYLSRSNATGSRRSWKSSTASKPDPPKRLAPASPFQ
jgi:peptide deformylase